MKVYLVNARRGVNATGEFNPTTNALTVLKGSVLSKDVAHTPKFRGSKTIEKYREGRVQDCILLEDVSFKSSSTAGNFVTGRSTNGPAVWKDDAGRTVKEIISEIEG